MGSAVVTTWPLVVHSQQARKLPTIGFLGPTTASATNQWVAAFVHRLEELGWIEGRTVAIEYRWAEGRIERASEIATEFIRLQVDLIVTHGYEFTGVAKQATSVIPIVFALAGDPVGTGLVTDMARPGGNVTGLSVMNPELAGKRLELLREIVPGFRRVAILANIGNPGVFLEMGEVQTAARTLGLDVVTLGIRRPEDIAPAFETLRGRAQALYVAGDPLVVANHVRINSFAVAARLPAIYNQREYVAAGGLMSLGPNFRDLFQRAAEYADKILRGAKPADLPIQQPTRFELGINLNTAKALDLTIPPSLLARADDVIE
jgi:putative ABC transport system substrate-binding protein